MPKVSEEYKIKVKNLIYQAALKNFAKAGYANTKMEDIAKTAKVSKGTLYLYFQSKEELFYHMCRQNQQILIEIREGLFKKKSDLMADLNRFYDDIVSKEGDTERTWVEGIAESLHNKKIKHMIIQQRKNLDEIVTEFLKQMKRDGGFFKDDTDLKALARGMIALYNGLMIMRVTDRTDDSVKSAWVKTMHAMITGASN